MSYDAAYLILDAFIHYQHEFKRITKRAGIRFENKDWHGVQFPGKGYCSIESQLEMLPMSSWNFWEIIDSIAIYGVK